eukprot:Opistho-1_new@74995
MKLKANMHVFWTEGVFDEWVDDPLMLCDVLERRVQEIMGGDKRRFRGLAYLVDHRDFVGAASVKDARDVETATEKLDNARKIVVDVDFKDVIECVTRSSIASRARAVAIAKISSQLTTTCPGRLFADDIEAQVREREGRVASAKHLEDVFQTLRAKRATQANPYAEYVAKWAAECGMKRLAHDNASQVVISPEILEEHML